MMMVMVMVMVMMVMVMVMLGDDLFCLPIEVILSQQRGCLRNKGTIRQGNGAMRPPAGGCSALGNFVQPNVILPIVYGHV